MPFAIARAEGRIRATGSGEEKQREKRRGTTPDPPKAWPRRAQLATDLARVSTPHRGASKPSRALALPPPERARPRVRRALARSGRGVLRRRVCERLALGTKGKHHATRAAEAPLHEISADAILQSRSLASRKSERRVQVRSTCTPGYTKFDFSRLITIRKRSPRRGESGWKGSCRCVQRLDLNAQASRLCASRALRLARSGCTQRRPECEKRRRATLRVYTREAWGPPRAGLRA